MDFIEETLHFTHPLAPKDSPLNMSFSVEGLKTIDKISRGGGGAKVAGINVRLGNQPIVRNLKKLLELSNANLPPEIEVLFEKRDIFSIVHGIGAIRVEGDADIEELQYHAKVVNINNAQTIDLIPSTKFREALNASVTIEGAMTASGNISAKIPNELTAALLPTYINLGGDMSVQLSSNASFLGKFVFSVKFPVIQSAGVASDSCSWILSPDENKTPLLGDQLLIQFITVPKGITELKFEVYGVVKVDKGIFYSPETKNTGIYEVIAKL